MNPQADQQRVADAIRAAERKTTGEIFCVIADQACRYPLAPFSAAAVFALLIPLWLILLTDKSAATIYLVQLAGFVLAAAAFSHPRLRYRLVPRVLQHDRAHLTAMRQFWAQGLHKTPSRTGVLIFAAQAERYATVIADEVIHPQGRARRVGRRRRRAHRGDPRRPPRRRLRRGNRKMRRRAGRAFSRARRAP